MLTRRRSWPTATASAASRPWRSSATARRSPGVPAPHPPPISNAGSPASSPLRPPGLGPLGLSRLFQHGDDLLALGAERRPVPPAVESLRPQAGLPDQP